MTGLPKLCDVVDRSTPQLKLQFGATLEYLTLTAQFLWYFVFESNRLTEAFPCRADIALSISFRACLCAEYAYAHEYLSMDMGFGFGYRYDVYQSTLEMLLKPERPAGRSVDLVISRPLRTWILGTFTSGVDLIQLKELNAYFCIESPMGYEYIARYTNGFRLLWKNILGSEEWLVGNASLIENFVDCRN